MAKKLSYVALAGLLASVQGAPQAVTGQIAPPGNPPSGCSLNYNGRFQIVVQAASGEVKRQDACDAEGALALSLSGGVLTDRQGRTGYIADNYQFQFDGPPQAGALFTAGFSVCSSGVLGLGSSSTFYRCSSGAFYNLYDRNWAPQCEAIQLAILPCPGSAPPAKLEIRQAPPVSQIGDGQIQAPPGTPAGKPTPSQLPPAAGTPGAPSAPVGSPTNPPVSQIGDGQIQAPGQGAGGSSAPPPPPPAQTGSVPVQSAPPAGAPVTQIGDGQIQAPVTSANKPPTQPSAPVVPPVVAPPVSQISDGQIQAPVSSPLSPVAPPPVQTGPAVAPSVPTPPSGPAVSQISDGQIQAPVGSQTGPVAPPPAQTQPAVTPSLPIRPSGPAVSQISDGQIQAPTGPVPVNPPGQSQVPPSAPTLPIQAPSPPAVAPSSAFQVLPHALLGLVVAAVMMAVLA